MHTYLLYLWCFLCWHKNDHLSMVTLLHHISVFINESMAYTPPSLAYLTGFPSVFGWLRHSKQVASRHGNTSSICSCSVPMLFCLFLVYVLSLFRQIFHALSYKSDSLKGYLQSHYCEWWRHLLYWSSAHCKYSTHGKIRIILCILSKYWEPLYSSFVHVLGLRLCMYIMPYLYLSLHTVALMYTFVLTFPLLLDIQFILDNALSQAYSHCW